MAKYQSFINKDNVEIERYNTYTSTKADVIILVQIDAAILSIKVGNSYVSDTYMLSDIRKTEQTADDIDIYTFSATNNKNGGVQTFTLRARKKDGQAVLEIPYRNSSIAKEQLFLIEVERGPKSLREMY